MLRSSLLIMLLAFSASASAQGFDYNWLGFGYGTIDFDDFNADCCGCSFPLRGAGRLTGSGPGKIG